MSNRQSNILFYSIIFLVISAALINNYQPGFFDNFTKSKEEFLIKEAMQNNEHTKALASYKDLVRQNISQNNENTVEMATMYEEIANIHSLLGNKKEQENYYLKSLEIKKQLKKGDIYSFAKTYYKLGSLAQQENKFNQAQDYFEKSLLTRLGDIAEFKIEDEGMFIGMQQSRIKYLRLNHEDTILTYKKLASIHSIKKEYPQAKEYYDKALTASTNTFGAEDTKTLEIIGLIKQLPL